MARLAPEERATSWAGVAVAVAVGTLPVALGLPNQPRAVVALAVLAVPLLVAARARSIAIALVAASVAGIGALLVSAWISTLLAVDGAAGVLAFTRGERGAGRRWGELPQSIVGGTLLASHVLVLQGGRVRLPLAIVVGGLLLGAVVDRLRPDLLARQVGSVHAAARRLGTVTSSATVVVAVTPIIVAVWAGQRLVRYDPLRAPTRSGTRWVPRTRTASEPERAYAVVGVAHPTAGRRRVHRALAGVSTAGVACAMALVAAAVGGRIPELTGDSPFEVAAPERPLAAEPWYDVLADEIGSTQLHWSQAGLFVTDDLEGDLVNVSAGRRRTANPSCACEPIRVWMFGGSALYGYWQRDDHTIASELARVADAEGVHLEVTNFGQPAYTLWQEVDRLTYLLASEPQQPDVVLFLDGANELGVQVTRDEDGYGNDTAPGSALDRPMRQLFPRAQGLLGWQAPGLEPDEPPRGDDPDLPPADVGRVAVERYAEAVEAARLVVEAAGARAGFAWQPIYTGTPGVGDEDWVGPALVEEWRLMSEAVDDALPEGVVDLRRSLDDADRPVFYDLMHLNEAGARLLAERWFEELRRGPLAGG